MPPQETKWTHAPLSGHESRCCSFCNKRAKRRDMWVRNGARRDGCRTSQTPSPRPARATCGRLVVPHTQSDGWVVQAARARSIPALTTAAHPTAPVAAACTAWDAAAGGDVRTSESARWDGLFQPSADHCCRYPIRPALPQETCRYHWHRCYCSRPRRHHHSHHYWCRSLHWPHRPPLVPPARCPAAPGPWLPA